MCAPRFRRNATTRPLTACGTFGAIALAMPRSIKKQNNRRTLRVHGKGRREVRLPLPQDAGDALLDYLEQAQPRVDDDRMFLRSAAPYRPFAGPCAIWNMVRLALKRAGITDPPPRGANLLRHSAATGNVVARRCQASTPFLAWRQRPTHGKLDELRAQPPSILTY